MFIKAEGPSNEDDSLEFELKVKCKCKKDAPKDDRKSYIDSNGIILYNLSKIVLNLLENCETFFQVVSGHIKWLPIANQINKVKIESLHWRDF